MQFNRVIDGRCGHGKYARSLFALPSNASYSAAKRRLPRWGQWLTANAQMSNAMFGATTPWVGAQVDRLASRWDIGGHQCPFVALNGRADRAE